MKPQFAAPGLVFIAAFGPGLSLAAGPVADPAAQEAVALVEQGAVFLRAHGKAALISRINARDPQFYRGALYLHMRDARTGIVLAHPVHRWLVGQDLLDVPDAAGRKYRRDIIELAATRGKGWVAYTYKNPADGRADPRSEYIARVGDVVLESGIGRK